MAIRIVAISDTHGMHRQVQVPAGDILIHAGDLTHQGSLEEVRDFNAYLGELPHPHKIIIAGNHDFCFEDTPAAARALVTHAIYLPDQAVVIAGFTIYAAPEHPGSLTGHVICAAAPNCVQNGSAFHERRVFW